MWYLTLDDYGHSFCVKRSENQTQCKLNAVKLEVMYDSSINIQANVNVQCVHIMISMQKCQSLWYYFSKHYNINNFMPFQKHIILRLDMLVIFLLNSTPYFVLYPKCWCQRRLYVLYACTKIHSGKCYPKSLPEKHWRKYRAT